VDIYQNGDTAIHLASSKGHLSVIKLLVDRGAKVDVVNYAGNTALHAAILFDQLRTAEYLVSIWPAGALVANHTTHETPLQLAVRLGRVEMCRCLLPHCAVDVNVPNAAGSTLLCVAASMGYADICTMLLQSNADPSIKDKVSDALYEGIQGTESC
jgi:ankyrin repeat protein